MTPSRNTPPRPNRDKLAKLYKLHEAYGKHAMHKLVACHPGEGHSWKGFRIKVCRCGAAVGYQAKVDGGEATRHEVYATHGTTDIFQDATRATLRYHGYAGHIVYAK